MNRRGILGAATVGVILSAGGARASAQPGGRQKGPRRPGQHKPGSGRGGPIRIPVLLELKNVPVGSWAEYAVNQGGRAPRTVRQVLLQRDETTATVEVVLEVQGGGLKAAQPRTRRKVTRMVVDLDLNEAAPREVVVQRAGAQPRILPPVSGARRRLLKLDPKAALGSETVAVGAGTFQAQHYRDTSPRGGTIDIWASHQAPPFGLVRMERHPGPSAPRARAAYGQVTYALARMGNGAKPSITGKVRPLSAAQLQCPDDSFKRR